ncbi:HIT family protein [Paenibacillus doosanensis]|uniref:HIT family protein n=1 Tax=Paenibacillus doosanensis TaxID=1229154 RepID=UPI00217FD05F|nr:HIT family protein [Paenibacillus doosanensis]MCS7458881.1 HIT family protein [Paenibacillus doosanensis]
MNRSESCLGCRLALGIQQAQIVYEDQWVTCLLDHEPFSDGHTLIVPKRHVLDVDELDEETAGAVMRASSLLSAALKALYRPDGITVIQNGGAFNDLRHYHMHVFPRYAGDGFAWQEPHYAGLAKKRLALTRERLSSELQSRLP